NHVARNYSSKQKDTGAKMFGHTDNTDVHFDPQNNYYYFPGEAFRVPKGILPLGPDLVGPYQDESYFEEPAKATGNDVFRPDPSVNDWFETVKLNYGVDYLNGGQKYFDPIPDTWLKMLEILKFWSAKGVDGFRCDMVHMVPVEFWRWVIPKLKEDYPELIFIGEIYNQDQYREYIHFGHFDYLYDKVQLYDTLKKIMTQNGSTHWLTGIWQHLRGINKNMLRFLENHDEQRIASHFFAGDARFAKPAMFVSATWHTGPIMLYFGQEVGEPALYEAGFSKDDGRTTIFDYWGVSEHQKWVNNGAYDGGQLSVDQKSLRLFHQEILKFSRKYKAIKQGYFYDLNPHLANTPGYTDKVLTYLRWFDGEHLLFVANFSANHEVEFELSFPDELVKALEMSLSIKLKAIFGTEKHLDFNGKTPIQLSPLDTLVFQF
ncbi:MAG: alpha-amylase family glycosyl hydrolase, partial [Bacteroidota bacterium]